MDSLSLSSSITSDNLYSRSFPVTVGQPIGTNRGLLWCISDLALVGVGVGVTAEIASYHPNGTTFAQQIKIFRYSPVSPALSNIMILPSRIFSVISLPAGTTCAALA